MKILNKSLKNIARGIVAYPKSVLVFCLIFCALLSINISKLEIDASTQTLLLENDKDLLIFKEVSKRYEMPNFLVLAYTPNMDLLSQPSLKFLSQISKDLEQIKGVKSVLSLLNAPLLQNKPLNISQLLEHIPNLQDDGIDLARARAEFLNSPLYRANLVSLDFKTTSIIIYLEPNDKYEAYIKERDLLKQKIKDGKASDDEKIKLKALEREFKEYRDALRLSEHESLKAIRAIIAKYNGISFNSEQNSTSSSNFKANEILNAPSKQDTLIPQLFLGGMNMIADDMIGFVKADLVVYSFAAALLAMACLWLFYKQMRFVILPIFICALSLLTASGLFGLLGFEITVISSNYTALAIIITLSVVIHLINAYREFAINKAWLNQAQLVYLTLISRFKPCFFAVFTTVIGFISLMLADIRPVAMLGVMMSVAICISLVLAFLLFGAIMCLLNKKAPKMSFERHFSLTKYCANIVISSIGRKYIYLLSLIVFCFGLLGILRLEVENSFIGYFKQNTDIYRGMKIIDTELGGTVPLDIVINFKDNAKPSTSDDDELASFENEFSQNINDPKYWFSTHKMAVIKKVDEFLKKREFVGSVSSLNTLLELGKDLNGGRSLDSLALALLYNGLNDEQRALLLTPYVNIENNEAHFSIRTIDSDEKLKRDEFLRSLEADLNKLLANDGVSVQVSGVMRLYNNMLGSLVSSQTDTLIFVVIALFLTFLVLFRSFKLSLIAIISNIVPLCGVFGLMGLAGISLDIMSITIAAISLGIGVDDIIHYIHRYKIELVRLRRRASSTNLCHNAIINSHASIGYAMYYTSFTVFLGFGVMMSSNFWPTIYFGFLTDLVMFLMLASALLLMPAMLVSFFKLKF